MEARALKVHPDDDVAVLLSPALAAGTRIQVDGREFQTDRAIMSGHKIALRPLAPGEPVKKYGQPFGRVTEAIAPGAHVHTHNVATALDKNEEYEWERPHPRGQQAALAPSPPGRGGGFAEAGGEVVPTFRGYVRADGRVGIRNELWILCTVGCINRVAEEAARQAHQQFAVEQKLVDGVYAHTHPYGCAQLGDDLLQTRRATAALAAHPNCAGVLLMGLGCESNQMSDQVAALRNTDLNRVRYFSAQTVDDEIAEAVRVLGELAAQASQDERQTLPASRLVIGMKCGGSDGFSGLTANPLVGVLSDRIAAWGGVSILTEVPEMFGAERLLMQRADSRETFENVGRMINRFKDYFRRYDEPISENPAPGNKAGGITTLEEKSLGCIQKGGASAPVRWVLDYGEPVPVNPENDSSSGGLALAYGPGNDSVSCTTLAAAGAQMVLFTTGRGTPFGTCVPTLKISTNSDLALRKPRWIDFDAGQLVETGVPMETLADQLQQLMLAVASGERQTHSETNGCREIALFKDGITN